MRESINAPRETAVIHGFIGIADLTALTARRTFDGDSQLSGRYSRANGGRSDDRPLPPGQSLQPGTRVVTPRRGYRHHGIYVGRGTVIHYGGLVRGRHRGPVEEVSLEQFTNGRPLWVRYERSPCFDPDEVIRRARSRVGEDRYRLLTNNCEHFCEWCLRAEHRSYQVDEWLSRPYRALRMTVSCVELRTTMFLDHMQALLLRLVSRLFGSVAHTIRSLGANSPEIAG